MKILTIAPSSYSYIEPYIRLSRKTPDATHEILLMDINHNGGLDTSAFDKSWELPILGHNKTEEYFTPTNHLDQNITNITNRIEAIKPDLILTESFSSLAITSAELCKVPILNLLLFPMEPRVSYKKNLLEKIKVMIDNKNEFRHINAYRASMKLERIKKHGYRSSFMNLILCDPIYMNGKKTIQDLYLFEPFNSTCQLPAKKTRAKIRKILCCFGTTVDSSPVIKELANSKYEEYEFTITNASEKPPKDNLKYVDWHDFSNLKDFDLVITHGGFTTTQLIIKNKVPIIVVPFFGDQFAHADRVVNLGLGVKNSIDKIGSLGESIVKIQNSLESISNCYLTYFNTANEKHKDIYLADCIVERYKK